MKDKILVICGPTASGKTALAIKLAGTKPASIISADSRQIYVGLDVVTGKDIPDGSERKNSPLSFNNRPVDYFENKNLRFWGLDLLSPDQVYNAADFSILSQKIINWESKQGRVVFVVGGTGFYLKAMVYPESLVAVLPNKVLRQELYSLNAEELAQKLWEVNPQKFVSMNQSDVNNPRRLVRAIEVASSNSSHESGQLDKYGQPPSFSWLGIRAPLSELKERIEARIRSRLDRGAVTEVENLWKAYPDQNLPVYTTLGIRPIVKFIAKEIDLSTLIETWVVDEMNYAKRQLTWFKKQPSIIWYDLNQITNLSLDPLNKLYP